MNETTQDSSWQALARAKYCQLASFRKIGIGVATPVWFAIQGSRAYVGTEYPSGKVKRVRNHPEVLLAASSVLGRVRGPFVAGRARELQGQEAVRAEQILKQRYGIGRRLLNPVLQAIFKAQGKSIVWLEIERIDPEEFRLVGSTS